MRNFRPVLILISFVCLSFQTPSNSDRLNAIIANYEAERDYGFKMNESVENTIKYYQAEADFAKNLKGKLETITEENLSESEKISKELLLFVLQDKIDTNRFKTYLNTITNEYAFHLELSRMGNITFQTKKQVDSYLRRLDDLPQRVDYNINILKTAIKEDLEKRRNRHCSYEQ